MFQDEGENALENAIRLLATWRHLISSRRFSWDKLSNTQISGGITVAVTRIWGHRNELR